MAQLKNISTGEIKEIPVGFSWTTLLFGFFPALFRGDIKWTLIMLVLGSITFGISSLVFCFTYNKIYMKGLVEKGYVPYDDEAKAAATKYGILFAEVN